MEEGELPKPVVKKVSQEEKAGEDVEEEAQESNHQLYDSRSSLQSEMSELRRRSEERRRGGEGRSRRGSEGSSRGTKTPLDHRSDSAQAKIRDLRQQVRGYKENKKRKASRDVRYL